MPRTKLYKNNAERQKAYSDRKKEKEENSKPVLDWERPLIPFVEYFKSKNNLENIPEFQANICNTMADFTINNLIVSSGRGIGKTQISSTFALWLADEYSRFIKKGLDVTLISSQPTIYTNLDRIFLSHRDLKERLRSEGRSLEIPQKNFQFKDTLGYVERILPTSNQIRSHRCNCLILDECASIPTPIIKTALPLLKDDIAKVILISTPHKERSLFNDYVANLPKDWVLLQYSSELADWTSRMRKLAKETLTQEEYEIEINAKIPEESIKTLLSSKDVDSCCESFVSLSGLPDTKLQIGIDWGYSRSLSCAVLCEHSKAYKRIIKIWVWNQENIESLYSELGTIILNYWRISN